MMKHLRPRPPQVGRRGPRMRSPIASGAACYLAGCGIGAIIASLAVVCLDQELSNVVSPSPLNRLAFGLFD